MKKLSIAFAIASTALAASPAFANPTNVSWSRAAAGCTPDNATVAAGLASFDAAHGTVTFAAGKSGHIHLICPVASISTTAVSPSAVFLTFYNDSGFVGGVNHCTVGADLLRTNLDNVEHGADIVTVTSQNQVTTGRSLFGASFVETFDLDTSYYWVDVDLFRDSGTATCNPTLVGTYLATPPLL